MSANHSTGISRRGFHRRVLSTAAGGRAAVRLGGRSAAAASGKDLPKGKYVDILQASFFFGCPHQPSVAELLPGVTVCCDSLAGMLFCLSVRFPDNSAVLPRRLCGR
jgi:hypothetical protein